MEDDFKLVEAYWREWEHRHSLFWSLYLKSVLAVFALFTIPFIGKSYLVGNFVMFGISMPAENIMLVVPVISLVVVYFAHELLSQEYARIQITGFGYQDAFDAAIIKLGRFRRYGETGPTQPDTKAKPVRKYGLNFSSHIVATMQASLFIAVAISVIEVFVLLGV